MNGQDQFILRVKLNSGLDKMLRHAANGATKADISSHLGIKNASRASWLAGVIARCTDNLHIHRDKDTITMSYVNVAPQQVQVVTSDVNFNNAQPTLLMDEDVELDSKLRWPVAPPLIEPMEQFDTPTYYSRMKTMVKAGRHISLEGPPSVGKDTAVEQLAADMGKPLVTIGGDAGFRTRDLTGSQQIVNGTSFFDVGDYVAAAVNGWWVLLTEVNAADPSAIMYINRQLAAPYVVNLGGKSFPVHPDFRLFVTYNHGLVGTKPLPQSFKDRFFSVKVPFFTEAQLRKRLDAMGWSLTADLVNEHRNNTVVTFGIAMWNAHERGQMRYQITTRRLHDAVMLSMITGMEIEAALKCAVIDAIDSAVEAKAALEVLSSVLRTGRN